jgi:hypothetical protein
MLTWSFVARKRSIRLAECKHATCANCFAWAHEWHRTRIEPLLGRHVRDGEPPRAQRVWFQLGLGVGG